MLDVHFGRWNLLLTNRFFFFGWREGLIWGTHTPWYFYIRAPSRATCITRSGWVRWDGIVPKLGSFPTLRTRSDYRRTERRRGNVPGPGAHLADDKRRRPEVERGNSVPPPLIVTDTNRNEKNEKKKIKENVWRGLEVRLGPDDWPKTCVCFFFFFQACLVSYATETVMGACHGKRNCRLTADAATFGNPCKPASRMYLKVVYNCGE